MLKYLYIGGLCDVVVERGGGMWVNGETQREKVGEGESGRWMEKQKHGWVERWMGGWMQRIVEERKIDGDEENQMSGWKTNKEGNKVMK